MNRTILTLLGAACLLVAAQAVSRVALAETTKGPSLRVTTRWIQEKITSNTTYYRKYQKGSGVTPGTTETVYFRISFSGCLAKLTRTHRNTRIRKNHVYTNNDHYVFSIHKLNTVKVVSNKPNRVGVYGWVRHSWAFSTRENGKLKSSKSGKQNIQNPAIDFISRFDKRTPDPKMAARVANAFRHAIALCRRLLPGKKEPF